jgi:Uma2 family endonuclease
MAGKRKVPLVFNNMAEVMERIGDIPLARIRMRPPPGTATEEDVLAAWAGPNRRLCELVDGVLVEKAVGLREALLAGEVIRMLGNFNNEKDLGVVLGADGMIRLEPGLVRIPDVSFIPWEVIPGEKVGDEAMSPYIPSLAVEVLSPSNTKKEIERKLRDYFLAGVRLVWVIEPKTETARAYTSPTEFRRIAKSGNLQGRDVLPGFSLPLAEVFAAATRRHKRLA